MSGPDPLCKHVQRSLRRYFKDLKGEQPSGLYSMVIEQTEKPLLQVVMEQVEGNQTKAARILGINRNTLRKKLRLYGLE
ncbi:MAG: Fis family transcriptional regulator [Gammaproteobacteria bacterium]|nr:Fis family transcriptional regulator [Gammaproteobacteria bacterium]